MAGTSAFTATFTPIAKGKSMVMTGKIIRGDAQRLVDAYNASCAQRNRCPDRIFLDSHGGSLLVATDIASKVIESGMLTVVGRTDTCVSACVLVFASGSHLVTFPTSQIGVHRVYNIGENAYGEEIAVDTDSSILLTVKVAQTYRDWGVPDIVIDKMVATSGNNVTWIKAYEWPAIEVIQ